MLDKHGAYIHNDEKMKNTKGIYYFRGLFNISLSGLLNQIISEYGNRIETIEDDSILHVYENKIKEISILDFVNFTDVFFGSKEADIQTIENILKAAKSTTKNRRIKAWVENIKSDLLDQKSCIWNLNKISKLSEKENAS